MAFCALARRDVKFVEWKIVKCTLASSFPLITFHLPIRRILFTFSGKIFKSKEGAIIVHRRWLSVSHLELGWRRNFFFHRTNNSTPNPTYSHIKQWNLAECHDLGWDAGALWVNHFVQIAARNVLQMKRREKKNVSINLHDRQPRLRDERRQMLTTRRNTLIKFPFRMIFDVKNLAAKIAVD